jgi:general secretion pathway protein D
MRILRSALAVIILFSSFAAVSESAKSLYKKGVDADARQDYEAAYEFYKAAYEKNPKDLKYRVPYQRTRFLAAASKVHRGQKLREQGKLQEALELFQQAAQIDPTNDLAQQEIRRTQQMMGQQTQAQAPAEPKQPRAEDLLRKRLEQARPPVELAQLSDVPITGLKMENDSKIVYETLGKLAGINVLFDPDYTGRRIPIDLQHVTLREALDIVGMESRTFWRPVTPNTIFVAQDTPTKRKELEQNVIKTFYLGNSGGSSTSNTDLQDVVTSIRTLLEVQRIQHIPSQNAIIMKGTPDQIIMAQKIIDDLDRAKAEVVIDVVVAQVSASKTRNLGILPPQNATVSLQGSSPTTTGGTTTSPSFSFHDLEHLTEGNFAVKIDPASAQLLLSSSDAQILQSPRIRSADNEKAQLKIATKIPIATGSFGTPLGITGGASLGVNTQFTYLDVGVILEITPHVHPDGQVTLKTSLELSSQTGNSDPIGGISQPIIAQDKIDHTIRLRDGEINLLGGIMETTETKTNSGWPLLSSIPILKYFFSQEQKKKSTNEIVFLLIPHIVRSQELSDVNRRAIDVGTASGIELRSVAQPPKTETEQQSGRVQQAQSATPPAQQSQPQASGTLQIQSDQKQSQPTANTPAEDSSQAKPSPSGNSNEAMSFKLSPSKVSPTQGSSFAIEVVLSNAHDVHSIPLQITYDPNVLQFVNVSNGGFLSKDGQQAPLVNRNDPATGTLQIMAQRPPGVGGVSGDGTVFNLVFIAKSKGSGVVSITVPGARNSQNQPIRALGSQAAVTVN